MYSQTVKETILNRDINFQHTSYYGGYITYIKLWFQFVTFLFTTNTLTVRQRLGTWLVFLLKTPWWILVKPLGCVFSIVHHYTGEYTLRNEQLTQSNVKKYVTFRVLYIPVFHFRFPMNDKDWEYIFER